MFPGLKLKPTQDGLKDRSLLYRLPGGTKLTPLAIPGKEGNAKVVPGSRENSIRRAPKSHERLSENLKADTPQPLELPPTEYREKMLSSMKAPRVVFKGHQMPVHCVGSLAHPDLNDTLLFSGGEDKLVIVWSLRTGNPVAELAYHGQRVTGVCGFYAPELGIGPLVVSASWDQKIVICPLEKCFVSQKTENGEVTMQTLSKDMSIGIKILKGHKNRIMSICIIHNSTEQPVLVSGSADNSIILWSIKDEVKIHELNAIDETWNMCVSSWRIEDRTVILSGCKNGSIRIWPGSFPGMSTRTGGGAGGAGGEGGSTPVRALVVEPTNTKRGAFSQPLLVIKSSSSAVHSIAPFDADGSPFVAAASKSKDIFIYSMLTGNGWRKKIALTY
jgi:WD40 repeat protein